MVSFPELPSTRSAPIAIARREIAAEVKSLSPSKPVGTGEEGFEPFERDLESPWIDFGSAHFFPEAWSVPRSEIAGTGARWIERHAAASKPIVLGEFALRNDGMFDLAERRAIYRGWFACAARSGLAGSAPWLFANDARRDDWDRHTFYFRDGTRPEDPQNRYADLLIEAARAR